MSTQQRPWPHGDSCGEATQSWASACACVLLGNTVAPLNFMLTTRVPYY